MVFKKELSYIAVLVFIAFAMSFAGYAGAQNQISQHSEVHTSYCAGLNEALSQSGWQCDCTRKGYYAVTSTNTGSAVYPPVVAFSCKQIAVVPSSSTDYCLTPPVAYTDGTALNESEILGYQCKTVLKNGVQSEWNEIQLKQQ